MSDTHEIAQLRASMLESYGSTCSIKLPDTMTEGNDYGRPSTVGATLTGVPCHLVERRQVLYRQSATGDDVIADACIQTPDTYIDGNAVTQTVTDNPRMTFIANARTYRYLTSESVRHDGVLLAYRFYVGATK